MIHLRHSSARLLLVLAGAALLSVVLLDGLLVARARARWAAGAHQPESYVVGDTFTSARDLRATAFPTTLLIFSNSGCGACRSESEFHRRLLSLSATEGCGQVYLVAFSDDAATPAALGVPASQVRVAADTRVSFVPTLVLLDSAGKVSGVWRGRVNPPERISIVRELCFGGDAVQRH